MSLISIAFIFLIITLNVLLNSPSPGGGLDLGNFVLRTSFFELRSLYFSLR